MWCVTCDLQVGRQIQDHMSYQYYHHHHEYHPHAEDDNDENCVSDLSRRILSEEQRASKLVLLTLCPLLPRAGEEKWTERSPM